MVEHAALHGSEAGPEPGPGFQTGTDEATKADDLTRILEVGGIDYEDEMVRLMCSRMEGQTVHEMIATGYTKFAACEGTAATIDPAIRALTLRPTARAERQAGTRRRKQAVR